MGISGESSRTSALELGVLMQQNHGQFGWPKIRTSCWCLVLHPFIKYTRTHIPKLSTPTRTTMNQRKAHLINSQPPCQARDSQRGGRKRQTSTPAARGRDAIKMQMSGHSLPSLRAMHYSAALQWDSLKLSNELENEFWEHDNVSAEPTKKLKITFALYILRNSKYPFEERVSKRGFW